MEQCPGVVVDVRLYFFAEAHVKKYLPDVGTIADWDIKSDVVLYFVFWEGLGAKFEIIDSEDLMRMEEFRDRHLPVRSPRSGICRVAGLVLYYDFLIA